VAKKKVEINHMGAGECFGEMTYLDETQMVRSATVTAVAPMTLVEIEGVSLRQASAGLQARFSSAFLKMMISRLRSADERYIASVGLHV
jgi:CRP-like cAMP-binding protein